ncbi:ABC transporter permease [Oribacterium sp. FC2011]|uniref:ABC transporter permease n=1 Tax=Oribacterium sp. FC2011 TaxID=1408311 RepID=UPI0004E1619B|nr:ABC transporter permease [Oribacterium sp. FC2011]
MNYASLFKGRTRALITDYTSLSVLIIIAIVSFYISTLNTVENNTSVPIAIVNNDEGVWGEEFINVLLSEESYDFYLSTLDDANDAIAKNRAHGIVVIKEDFSDKIRKGDYNSLISVTVMSDSMELESFTETVINDAIKIWIEALIESRLVEIAKADEEELARFRQNTSEIWDKGSLLDVEAYLVDTAEETDEEDNMCTGIRWYAALSLFYIIISGTWMCNYGSGQLIRRAVGRGANIALMFIAQALPGMILASIGLIPVLYKETTDARSFLLILLAYIVYSIGASGIALVVCSLSGNFSVLVLSAPVITLTASLMSGLLFRLPDWAGFWENLSIIFPGRWFYMASHGKSFLPGAVITSVVWLLTGILISGLISKLKKTS